MIASPVFADAAYYVGLLNEGDSLHEPALTVGTALGATPVITTDAILIEVFAYFGGRGRHARTQAVALVGILREDPQSTIVHQTRELFLAGVDLYQRRLDKGYSLTDCMSMVLCREMGLTDVLSHDRHFEQEGFRILL